jgi:tripartite-type tricarboxylate transporter receptor subunit TctC
MRMVLKLFASALCLAGVLIASAQAQEPYPKRPVTVVVPYPPGATTDIVGRMLADAIQKELGGTFIVENRAGAGTVIGATAVANSAPDGHMLLIAAGTTLAVNPSVYKTLSYDPVASFEPISLVAAFPFVLVVNPGLNVKSVTDLIALAKSKPDELTFASAGIGTPHHLYAELFMGMTGTKARHIPYKGSVPGVTDVAAGDVSFMFVDPAATLNLIKQGKVIALGVTSATRFKAMPDVPTIAEGGLPGYEAVGWMGLVAKAGTPRAITARLHKIVTSHLQKPEVEEKLLAMAIQPATTTPDEFRAYIASEKEKWAKVIKAAGIEPQ